MAEVASHSPTAEDANDTHTAGAEKGSVAAAADGATQAAGEGSGGRQHDGTGLLLPVARIKKMMKEAPDIKNVSADASWAVGRATELFLQELAARALTTTAADSNKKVLDYKDVAAGVHSWAALDFLKEMVPQKVKVGDVRQQLQKQLEEFMPKVLNDD